MKFYLWASVKSFVMISFPPLFNIRIVIENSVFNIAPKMLNW